MYLAHNVLGPVVRGGFPEAFPVRGRFLGYLAGHRGLPLVGYRAVRSASEAVTRARGGWPP